MATLTPEQKIALTKQKTKTPPISKLDILKQKAAPPAEEPMPTDPLGFAQWSARQDQNLLRSQQQQIESGIGQYRAASQAQEPLQAAYTRLGTEAGVPEIEKTIGGYKTQIATIQNQLNALEANINERTRGQGMTEAQRQRLIAHERQPLTEQLGQVSTAMAPEVEQLSAAQSKIATQLGLISQDQQKALQPLIMQIDTMSDRFSREINMYTSEKQTTLTALMDKLTRDRQLADREWQQAQDLAAEERKWAQTKEQLALQFSYDAKLKGMTSGEDTVTKPDAEKSLRNEMANYIAAGGNMDPNSGGANAFRAWLAKYAPYGFSSQDIKNIAASVYGG